MPKNFPQNLSSLKNFRICKPIFENSKDIFKFSTFALAFFLCGPIHIFVWLEVQV